MIFSYFDYLERNNRLLTQIMIKPEDGQVDARSPKALKEAGSAALKENDFARAVHMYTLGIEMIVDPDAAATAGGAAPTAPAPAAATAPAPVDAKGEEDAEATAASVKEPDWLELEKMSGGVLHALLSNRSLAFFKLKDYTAAAADAERCCTANPGFAKGHLRLIAALDGAAENASLRERRTAVVRGLRACPNNLSLETSMDKLVVEAGPQLNAELLAEDALDLKRQMEETVAIANDPTHKKHAIACGDYGSALAVGAHGLTKDVVEGEKYLQMGQAAGDIASSLNLGMLLLELDRPEGAAEALRVAAEAGSEEAGHRLRQLALEADKKKEQLMGTLKARASAGDEKARAMLQQFGIM